MYNKIQMKRAILTTLCFTTLFWCSILSLSRAVDRQFQEDISLITDRYTVQVEMNIKNGDYFYEDKIKKLEENLNFKDNTILTLKRQVDTIKGTYEEKLEKSELIVYHLESSVLSEEQLSRADEIAHIVASNYEEYGVLPSVAVGQAMQESQLGVICPKNNLWGINTGTYSSYPSLYDGVIKYLKVINNGLYDGALFNTDYKSSLYSIQSGGYCVPRDGYAESVSKCITSYNFTEYDKYYLGF